MLYMIFAASSLKLSSIFGENYVFLKDNKEAATPHTTHRQPVQKPPLIVYNLFSP